MVLRIVSGGCDSMPISASGPLSAFAPLDDIEIPASYIIEPRGDLYQAGKEPLPIIFQALVTADEARRNCCARA